MEVTKEEVIKKPKNKKHIKNNIKMFPLYRMVSWDLLFYYPIIFLFLTHVKGFTPAQALFADAFYTLANTFWQIPITRFIDRIGKKNCLIVGNILYSVSILAMIFMNNYYELLIIQFIYALGYSIKGICETNILYESLPVHPKKRGSIYSKIEEKASSNFFYFDALAGIIAGFTFIINGYIPMVLCFITCVVCTVLSFKFKHTTLIVEKVKPVALKEYKNQLVDAFRFFKRSKRIKSLFMFNAVFTGLIFGIVNLRSSMLNEMMLPMQYFGIIFAILQIGAGIMSRHQGKIQKVLRNKTLMVLSLPVTISCILVGVVGNDPLSKSSVILIVLLYLIQYMVKGPYLGLISRYLNNFTNKKIRPKVTAFKYLTSNLFAAFITALCALLLEITNTATTFIIVGCLSTIFIILILDYMKDRVGLKPESYTKEDVRYSIHKPNIKN